MKGSSLKLVGFRREFASTQAFRDLIGGPSLVNRLGIGLGFGWIRGLTGSGLALQGFKGSGEGSGLRFAVQILKPEPYKP